MPKRNPKLTIILPPPIMPRPTQQARKKPQSFPFGYENKSKQQKKNQSFPFGYENRSNRQISYSAKRLLAKLHLSYSYYLLYAMISIVKRKRFSSLKLLPG